MPRSICLLIVFPLCAGFSLCIGSHVAAQGAFPVKPGIADSSPLTKLSAENNSVTPASFLQTKKGNASSSSKSEQIPSILTGTQRTPTVGKSGSATPNNKTTPNNKIDPLNIPSRPIAPKKGVNALQDSSFFVQPPKSQPTRASSQKNGSKPGTKQNKTTHSPKTSEGKKSTPLASPQGIQRVADNSGRNTNGSANRSPTNSASKPELFVDPQLSPQLKVTAVGPKTISVNKTGKFELKVQNLGQVDANDLVVGIEIPSWVNVVGKPTPAGGEAIVKDLGDGKGIVWSLSYLPPGRDAVVSLYLEPKENRAFNLKTEWTTAPVFGDSKVMVTQPNLQTRISGPGEVKYGAKAVYTITIENSGNGMAEKVTVSLSESLGGDSATIGFISPGATKQFEVELTAGQAGPMKLEAFVNGDAGVKSEIAKNIIVRRAKLAVKANGPKFKYAGSAITYNISVENQGDATAKNISAAALLPINAKYISGLNQISENDGRKIGWKITEIPAGSKRDFIITCLINESGNARMEFGVRSGDGLTSGNVVNTKVEALADLKLEVVDPPGPQAIQREVTYELHIKNRGTKAAQNVLVSGEFSDFIDPITGTGAKSHLEQGGIITFDPIDQIKVGETVVLKVIAKAEKAGTHTFRAIVNCKEQDIRKISEGTTKFFGEGEDVKNTKSPSPEPNSNALNPPAPSPSPATTPPNPKS